MRKILTSILLFSSALLMAGQVETVSKSVADLASQYGWKHDTCYLSFQLNDVITVTGVTGNAKYCSDNTAKSMRYYQGSRKGEFAIQAKPGVQIQSIKLTYYVTSANSVATTDYGTDGKNIPAANQVKTGESFPVNANSITLYVGHSTNEANGQIRITNFEVTYLRSGNPMVSRTTQDLATQYGWSDLTCPRTFDLNEAVTVDVDSAGTMKYTMNTKQFHCYQWLGGFTIRANGERTIKSVKLTYFSVNSGVMTRNWGADGKQIPAADQIASGQTVEVNDQSVTFYVGTTGTNTDGQIRIQNWEVEYTEPRTSDQMIRYTIDLGKQYGWADAYCPVSVQFNNALTLQSDQTNNLKYYSTTKSFHCYQWCGGFSIRAREGAMIKSVQVYYDALNNGVLTQEWGTTGKNIPEEDWIKSGEQVAVNSDSVHFYIGDKGETDNCQIHITGFSIAYVDSLAHTETWAACASAGSEDTVQVVGDKGYYTWQLSHFLRTSDEYVGTEQGTRLTYHGAVQTDGVQEGGVKDISFDWRAGDGTLPVHFSVQAGEVTDEVQRANPGASSCVMNYTKQLAVKSNCALSVSLGAQQMPQQGEVVIGTVTITPYLLFTVPYHQDTLDTNQGSYDLKTRLINNTGEVPQYTIVSNTTGGEVTIRNGVVDLSAVTAGGEIGLQASWNGGEVSTTMTLCVVVAPKVYFEEKNKVVHLGDEAFVNPLHAPDSVGAVTYTSSDNKVAMVNDTGLVTITGLGQAVITAHVAATEQYVATSASYQLSVIYTPQGGTYFVETFSQCKKKQLTEGFAYVEGDDAVYDWNLSCFSRDKKDTIAGEQGIMLTYGGAIASNGVQEGGVKYLSFNWRVQDPMSPVHFMVNLDKSSITYSQEAVGDASLVMTYSSMFSQKSNTSFSISMRAKASPAQSQIVVSPLMIVPYLLFKNKYVELQLPATSYDCAEELINNTDGVDAVTYTILADPSGMATMEGSVLNLSEVTEPADIRLQATWGEVSTTMTVHLALPTALPTPHSPLPSTLYPLPSTPCTKFLENGQLRIYHDGTYYSIIGSGTGSLPPLPLTCSEASSKL